MSNIKKENSTGGSSNSTGTNSGNTSTTNSTSTNPVNNTKNPNSASTNPVNNTNNSTSTKPVTSNINNAVERGNIKYLGNTVKKLRKEIEELKKGIKKQTLNANRKNNSVNKGSTNGKNKTPKSNNQTIGKNQPNGENQTPNGNDRPNNNNQTTNSNNQTKKNGNETPNNQKNRTNNNQPNGNKTQNANNRSQNYIDEDKFCHNPYNQYDFFLAIQLSRVAFEVPTLFTLGLQYTMLNRKVAETIFENKTVTDDDINRIAKEFNRRMINIENNYLGIAPQQGGKKYFNPIKVENKAASQVNRKFINSILKRDNTINPKYYDFFYEEIENSNNFGKEFLNNELTEEKGKKHEINIIKRLVKLKRYFYFNDFN